MPNKVLAIANCRVSSDEQKLNNSLNRQAQAVLKAAEDLGVTIPDDGWWSGSISSKRGTNVMRKDLQEMISRCKQDKRIKYLIVDEPDRFMRSIDEAAYFEVTFKRLGVTVWYASDPDLNKGDLASKLLKFTKYLSAEGSNEERQNKSIAGQRAALKEGRYPFSPKPGYRRGYEKGIQEIHETRGPILKSILTTIAMRQITPTKALAQLNASNFSKGHSTYRMDKFRKIITDPFYAGIVEVHKQVNVRNDNGLHEPLITKEQHLELIAIMDSKKKTQLGPRKNGNPKYPLSNLVTCSECALKSNGRVVGFDHGNGKSKTLVYEKYRCRSCKRYLTRSELHTEVEQLLNNYQFTPEGLNDFTVALNTVWKQKEHQTEQEINRIKHRVRAITQSIGNQVDAATDPSNIAIKEDILASIIKKKDEAGNLEDQLLSLKSSVDNDRDQFLEFAFRFIENLGSEFLTISKEDRLRCKQLIFPAGFYLDVNNKVYTPEISPLYGLATNKKDLPKLEKSLLVRVQGL